MRSLASKVSKGKPNAFQFLLKYAAPNKPMAPMGVKLLNGPSCAALGIRKAATATMMMVSIAKRGLNFCVDIIDEIVSGEK
jgi:hypothetical protein